MNVHYAIIKEIDGTVIHVRCGCTAEEDHQGKLPYETAYCIAEKLTDAGLDLEHAVEWVNEAVAQGFQIPPKERR